MLRDLLLKHARRYPLMQPTDYAKLIYQAAFAGGHMIPSPEYALNRLKSEWNVIPSQRFESLIEPVGNGLSRLYLGPARQLALRPETVNALFVRTSVCFEKNAALFEKGMAEAAALADAHELPVSGEALRREKDVCLANDYAPFSHSAAYHAAYKPAYRLVTDQGLQYLSVLAAIDAFLTEKGRARIAIDGSSASGKSTLGRQLAEIYNAQLFHMDDFFLPQARKTPQRLAEAGGNVDYERFQSDVLNHLDEDQFAYRPFLCHRSELGEEIATQRQAVQIIEGSYAHHPQLHGDYDLKVFLSLNPDDQSARILSRNGAALHKRFMTEWVPLENRYFDACSIREQADILYIL